MEAELDHSRPSRNRESAACATSTRTLRFAVVLSSSRIARGLLIALVCSLSVGDSLGDSRPPNVVLIMADDLGYETVGCYGGQSYETPHLDRLAAEGVRFNRAYAMPLCTNTRIQLMTGKYNTRNWKAFGILDPKEKTFGHLLQQAGYRTCIAGKWQLTSYDPPDYPGAAARRNTGVHPRDAGFDEYCLWHVGHTEDKGSRYADPTIEQNGKLLTETKGSYGPDIWTDFIGDFMMTHKESPFFVYYSMALPHNPMVPTPDSREWRDASRRHSDETPFASDMIEYTDKMVGKILARLDDLKLRENTLVLFYSDNGTNWRVMSKFGGRMVRGGKGKGTELGIRVPSIASWPGMVEAGVVVEDLIDSVDFLPTVLDAAGAPGPDAIDGVSFLPLLKRLGPGMREWVYIHQDPRPGWDKDRFGLLRLALNDRFKLYEDGRLFDLKNDPFEETAFFVDSDNHDRRAGRTQLQRVLDSMKPYPMFEPTTVPRPNPSDAFHRHQFQDEGGYVVIEAEQLPTPRDESWRVENRVPGFAGAGYLRALRDQAEPPTVGMTRIAASIDVAGVWSIAIRCRSDHVSGDAEESFWIKAGKDSWMRARIDSADAAGKWRWVKSAESAASGKSRSMEATFKERGNEIWIAPCSQNLKIDRIVLYQPDRRAKALDVSTPSSPYHSWASP